ncbi:Nn.00g091040.m01.CDS01 [Neocucurbitaria sp. VM-36]
MRFLVSTAFLLSSSFTFAAATRRSGQPIIIDTDLFSDADDVGALTIANVLHNCGLAELKGIAINTPSQYGAPAANAICSYFGNGDVPVAAIRPLTNATFFDDWSYARSEYASKIAYNWPGTLTNASLTPTPVELYRSILASADNHSLHIISIGFLTNLADLLRSEADHISALSGVKLLEAKVSELIIMGGQYPSGWEFNFGGSDPNSTAYVLDQWPKTVAVTFSGGELGGSIISGQNLMVDPSTDSPILAAYQWYVGRGSIARETWDPITVLYGIVGLEGFSKLGMQPLLKYANRHGYNTITANNGSNSWINDTSVNNQHWLELANGVTNTSMAWVIDNFLIHPPGISRCLV